MKKTIFILLISIIGLSACNKDGDILTYEEQLAIDIEKIENYLIENELTAESTSSGLYYIIEEEGTGANPTLDDIVEVSYVGSFLNSGEVFDSSTLNTPPFSDEKPPIPLSRLIKGWQQGLPLFKVGGSGKLFIPSGLAYGNTDFYGIPANSVLIFEITLISVTDGE